MHVDIGTSPVCTMCSYMKQCFPPLPRALIRPGRFDTHINITLPDVKARYNILKVHASKIKLAPGRFHSVAIPVAWVYSNYVVSPDVDLETVARGTPGFSGLHYEITLCRVYICVCVGGGGGGGREEGRGVTGMYTCTLYYMHESILTVVI